MAATVTTASGLLKEWYLDIPGGPAEQLNNATVLSAQLERTSDNVVEGAGAIWDTHMSRSAGVGAIADNGTLPTAGNQTFVKATGTQKTLVGRIEFTVQSLEAAASNTSAFQRQSKAEMDGIVRDIKRQKERMLMGTSNGVIATCGTTTTSTTVQLLAAGFGASATETRQLRQLEDGFLIDIGTVAAPTTVASARSITAVDRTNATITISGAAVSTTSGTHFVFLSGAGGATGGVGQLELSGIQAIVLDSTLLFNIDPATYPRWKSTNLNNSTTLRPATEQLLIRGLQTANLEGGVTPDLIMANDGVERAIAANMLVRQVQPQQSELQGGYKGIAIRSSAGDATLVLVRDCPETSAYMVSTEHLGMNVWKDWGYMDQDGAVLSRVANKLNYEATYYCIEDIYTDKRNAHAVLKDLQPAN